MNHASPRITRIALGTALLALAAGTSGSAHALSGRHSVHRDDLARNAVTTTQVEDGSLTGSDIAEGTLAGLGTVSSALSADRAGNGAMDVTYRGAADTGTVIIFDRGGLRLKAECFTDVNVVHLGLTMESTVDDAAVFADTEIHDGSGNSNRDGGPALPQQGDFDRGDVVSLDGVHLVADDGQGLEINYFNPDGTEVYVKLQNWLSSGFAGAPADCFVGGVAFVV